LSREGQLTVMATPQMRAPGHIGLICGSTIPCNPDASYKVAASNSDNKRKDSGEILIRGLLLRST
jgi:hypothetical protein